MYSKRPLPNATTVLVLGIVSIVTAFCYGIIGIVCGIIALVLAKKDMQMYKENPEEFDGYSNLNAGRICAIVGLSLGCLMFLIFIVYIIFFASVLFPIISSAAAAGQ
jgi:hypothetical protein